MSIETQAPAVPLVNLTIDDRPVSVPKGTLLIEAARGMGIDIPYLCYHHKLTPFGGCRLCLVEVEKSPKMLAACNTIVGEGMVIRTSTDRVKAQRAGTIEFILLNHPLDCPVCDKGGECELQDRVFECGSAESRMTEPKVHIEDYDLGPLVVRNQDRCIICKRCIKVMEEIVGDNVLEFGQRGVTTEIYTFEHEPFKPGFSGNTIQVCPVGALMSKPFRFRARPWELIKTPSICSLCSMGCNVREDTRENRLLRVVGLENTRVNDGWLCDRGQFGYDYVNSPERLTAPLVRRDGELEPASWEEAYQFLATRLREVKTRYGGKAMGFIGSERASNEDNFVFQEFARRVVGSPNIDHRMGPGRTDYRKYRPVPGAIEALPGSDVVLLVGSDLTAEVPVLDLILKRSLLPRKMKLIVLNSRRVDLNNFASQWLRCAPGGETAGVNALVAALLDAGGSSGAATLANPSEPDGPRGGSGGSSLGSLCAAAGLEVDAVRTAAREFSGARLGSIIYSRMLADGPEGDTFQAALSNVAVLSGQAGRPGHVFLETVEECNTWGARDMGVLPASGPGGKKVEAGLGTPEMLRGLADGKLRGLYVMGSNPIVDYPDAALAARALGEAELVIVQDIFLTETAKLADIVLPTVTVVEENSTLTNVEGRVQRTVRAMDAMGASKPDWEILAGIAREMDASLGYDSLGDIEREIRAALARGNGSAEPGAATVPVASGHATGTVAAPGGYPLRLLTGAVMFDRDTLASRSTVLPGLAGAPYVEVSAGTAGNLGLSVGDKVAVEAAGAGSTMLELRVGDATPNGAAFIPAGFNESGLTALLNDEGRPVWVAIRRAERAR